MLKIAYFSNERRSSISYQHILSAIFTGIKAVPRPVFHLTQGTREEEGRQKNGKGREGKAKEGKERQRKTRQSKARQGKRKTLEVPYF